jgi:hypothetical protein
MVEVFRYKLCMFGVQLDGPANAFCDNQSVLLNSTLPLSTLKKKDNSVKYHKVGSCIPAGTICVTKEPGETNTSDLLTKFLAAHKKNQLLKQVLHSRSALGTLHGYDCKTRGVMVHWLLGDV